MTESHETFYSPLKALSSWHFPLFNEMARRRKNRTLKTYDSPWLNARYCRVKETFHSFVNGQLDFFLFPLYIELLMLGAILNFHHDSRLPKVSRFLKIKRRKLKLKSSRKLLDEPFNNPARQMSIVQESLIYCSNVIRLLVVEKKNKN